MYFDQRKVALHAVCWSNSFVFALKQVLCIFWSLTEKKEKKERKAAQKHAVKGGLPAFRCYFKYWLTPKSWLTPGEHDSFKFLLRKITFSPGADQLLCVEQILRVTPKCW